jgi:HlyD family secretion protein
MKRAVIIIGLLVLAGSATWWFSRSGGPAGPAITLTGSGVIEAETVAITAELGGRIRQLYVAEGDAVSAGQIVAELDQSALLAQQSQLEANLAAAKANLVAVSAPPRREAVLVAQALLSQAEIKRDGARAVWDNSYRMSQNPHLLQAQLNQARAQASEAAAQVELAQVRLKRAAIEAEAAGRDQSSHAALVQNEVAQYQLQAAQTGLTLSQIAAAGAEQQAATWAAMVRQPLQLIAQANAAQAAYRQAEAAVEAARANLVAVRAGPTPADIAVAQALVGEAEAALALGQAQLAKLTLTAPRAGLISQKLVNVGELAGPGAALFQLSDLDTVDLKIFIPETQIGQVQLGQKARVMVDAFPGQVFEGRVNFIAGQAEFTPRNVQSPEERVNLVFAVKIRLDNPAHRLKPGMPADAELLPEVAPPPPATASPVVIASPTPGPSRAQPSPTPAVTATPTAPLAEKVSPVIGQAEVVTYGLNVRQGPDMAQPVLATLAQGAIVPVLDLSADGNWLQVQLPADQGVGWVAANPAYVNFRRSEQ